MLTQKLRNLFIYFSRASYNGIHLFSMIFEEHMNLILIHIFVQFVANDVSLNIIESILMTIILCVYGGLYSSIRPKSFVGVE